MTQSWNTSCAKKHHGLTCCLLLFSVAAHPASHTTLPAPLLLFLSTLLLASESWHLKERKNYTNETKPLQMYIGRIVRREEKIVFPCLYIQLLTSAILSKVFHHILSQSTDTFVITS